MGVLILITVAFMIFISTKKGKEWFDKVDKY